MFELYIASTMLVLVQLQRSTSVGRVWREYTASPVPDRNSAVPTQNDEYNQLVVPVQVECNTSTKPIQCQC